MKRRQAARCEVTGSITQRALVALLVDERHHDDAQSFLAAGGPLDAPEEIASGSVVRRYACVYADFVWRDA